MAQHYEGEIITENGMDYEVVDAGGGFTGWDATAAGVGAALGGKYGFNRSIANQGGKYAAEEIGKIGSKGFAGDALKEAKAYKASTKAFLDNPRSNPFASSTALHTELGGNAVARRMQGTMDWARTSKLSPINWFSKKETVQGLRDGSFYRWHGAKPIMQSEAAVEALGEALKDAKVDPNSFDLRTFDGAAAAAEKFKGHATKDVKNAAVAVAEKQGALKDVAHKIAARQNKVGYSEVSKLKGGKLGVIGSTIAGVAIGGAALGLGHNMLMGGKEEKRQVLGPHTERVMAQEARQQAANINGAPMGVAAGY